MVEKTINDPRGWHITEKESTMNGELSASYLLRGVNGQSELIIGNGTYPDALGRAVSA